MLRRFFVALSLCAVLALMAGPLSAKAGTPVAVPAYRSGVAETPSMAQMPVSPSVVAPPVGQTRMDAPAYVLGVGDRVRLTVYGEEDLSGEYEISSTGVITISLIGEIRAAGTTIQAFEAAVRDRLSQGYLHDPKVSAQVANYRPFFILGEVSKPGSYPYVNGMNVLNAVAMAGGYTYRADKSGVTVVHNGDPQKKEYAIAEDANVAPGDILRVPERFF